MFPSAHPTPMRIKRSVAAIIFAAFFCAAGTLKSSAQKESTSRTTNRSSNTNVKETTLTKAQQDWLNINYKQLAGLRKDRAIAVVRGSFPAANEATMDWLISQATRLAAADSIAELRQQIEQLKAQRQSLLNKIIQKEAEAATPIDPIKKAKLQTEINQLKRQVAQLNALIEEKEKAIRKLQDAQ
jgi:hypothetical protein